MPRSKQGSQTASANGKEEFSIETIREVCKYLGTLAEICSEYSPNDSPPQFHLTQQYIASIIAQLVRTNNAKERSWLFEEKDGAVDILRFFSYNRSGSKLLRSPQWGDWLKNEKEFAKMVAEMMVATLKEIGSMQSPPEELEEAQLASGLGDHLVTLHQLIYSPHLSETWR